MALALTDLRLHKGELTETPATVMQKAFTEVFLPLPENTDYAASFGHIMGGYDAGYYGYAWSEVISADMFSPFKANPTGVLDPRLGMRLRNEIYSVGGSKNADESVKAFLGRPYSIKPFLEKFGILDAGR